jgi:hypothetical protein
LVIPGQLQILADEAPRQAFQSPVFEVHGEEADIGIHIGETERLVELDAVEDHHFAIDDGGIAQVYVAMALANEAFLLAQRQQRFQPHVAALCPGLQGVELCQVVLVGEKRPDLFEVLLDRSHCCLRRAGLVCLRHHGRGPVEIGNLPRQRIHVLLGQLTIGLQGAQQVAAFELAHLQGILDGCAFAAQSRRFRAAGDRQNLQIQVGCEALVQSQLLGAEVGAGGQFGEVQKTEIHRFLDLVSVRPGQYHPGDMRLDDLEPFHRMRVQGRVLQGGDQGLAHRRSFIGRGDFKAVIMATATDDANRRRSLPATIQSAYNPPP